MQGPKTLFSGGVTGVVNIAVPPPTAAERLPGSTPSPWPTPGGEGRGCGYFWWSVKASPVCGTEICKLTWDGCQDDQQDPCRPLKRSSVLGDSALQPEKRGLQEGGWTYLPPAFSAVDRRSGQKSPTSSGKHNWRCVCVCVCGVTQTSATFINTKKDEYIKNLKNLYIYKKRILHVDVIHKHNLHLHC